MKRKVVLVWEATELVYLIKIVYILHLFFFSSFFYLHNIRQYLILILILILSLSRMATPPVVRFPIFATVRAIGVLVILLLLTWVLHFRGGLALFSDNKDLIFNVINLFLFTLFLSIHLWIPLFFVLFYQISVFFVGIENVRMRSFRIIWLVLILTFIAALDVWLMDNGYVVICLCILRKFENQSMSRFGFFID